MTDRTRRQPQRSCVACRTTSDKRELIRIVRTPAGVELDPSGKKAGRGAYLCRQAACWQEVLRKGRLDAALKTKLTPEEKLKLNEFVASLGAVAV